MAKGDIVQHGGKTYVVLDTAGTKEILALQGTINPCAYRTRKGKVKPLNPKSGKKK